MRVSFRRLREYSALLIKASDRVGSANMTALGAGGFAPILAALSTMQSNAERSEKSEAHEYLEKFQKSVCRIRTSSIRLVIQLDIIIA